MAVITLTIASATKSWTVSAADITRILNAYKTSNNNPALTNAEIFDIIANEFIRDVKGAVRRVEQTAAVTAATAALVPIVAT